MGKSYNYVLSDWLNGARTASRTERVRIKRIVTQVWRKTLEMQPQHPLKPVIKDSGGSSMARSLSVRVTTGIELQSVLSRDAEASRFSV